MVIYTCGTGVYGSQLPGDVPATETSVLAPTSFAVSRIKMEQEYLNAGASVVRCGFVYGRDSSVFGMLFAAIDSSTFLLP